MRPLLLIALCSCSLYISEHKSSGPLPDAAPQPADINMVRCEDTKIYGIHAEPVGIHEGALPGHGVGQLLTTCIAPCRSSSAWCDATGCDAAISAVCGAPASAGKTCELAGAACQGSATISCPQASACGQSLPGASCSCAQGKYQCTEVTPVAATQQALVGKWRGTVTPPSFASPYEVSLWIYPDGTYWPQGGYETALFYGGDGPHPDRRISILSVSASEGASADIGIFFGSSPASIGAISGLTVDATSLRFTYYPAWKACGEPFTYVLARE